MRSSVNSQSIQCVYTKTSFDAILEPIFLDVGVFVSQKSLITASWLILRDRVILRGVPAYQVSRRS